MVMERSKKLVTFGLDAAKNLLRLAMQDGGYTEPNLWILNHGFFNGFTSVIETLVKVEKNGADEFLKEAIDWWIGKTRKERKSRVEFWRNRLTHQGVTFTAIRTTTWVPDEWHDHDRLVQSHVFAQVTHGGHTSEVTFEAWAMSQFVWLDKGIREIEIYYNRLKRGDRRTP